MKAIRLALLAVVALGGVGRPVARAGESSVRTVGHLEADAITESSGLAASHRGDFYWTHNDSGDGPRLFPVDPRGKAGNAVTVIGAMSLDWEDIASFVTAAGPRLLVADTGDNKHLRGIYQLYVLAEPERGGPVSVEQTILFSYPDKPHDCEGVAVTPDGREVLLATKGERCGVYVLALTPPPPPGKIPHGPAARVATWIADLPHRRVTALAMNDAGDCLAFLAGAEIFEYRRSPVASWAEALARPPRRYALPTGWNGEALCYTTDGKGMMLTREGRHSPLLYLELPTDAEALPDD